jgi:adenylyl cyclase-associated protein
MYLVAASVSKKPAGGSPSVAPALLRPIQDCMKEMQSVRDSRSPWTNHQNMLSEGLQSLGWLCVEPAPVALIESFIDGGDFWGNKIRVLYKSSPDSLAQCHIEFVTSFKLLLTELMAYVKKHHTTGVTWNPQGGDISAFSPSSHHHAKDAPTPAAVSPKAAASHGGGGGMQAIFAGIKAIDQTSGKTAGLKPVQKNVKKDDHGPVQVKPAQPPRYINKYIYIYCKRCVCVFLSASQSELYVDRTNSGVLCTLFFMTLHLTQDHQLYR